MALIAGQYRSTAVTYSDKDLVEALPTDVNGHLQISIESSTASYKGTVVITTPAAAGTMTPTVNGLVRNVTISTPALEGTGTATLLITDSLGGTYFSQAQNESVINNYGSIFPLATTDSIVVSANGTQSANRSIVFEMHYEK